MLNLSISCDKMKIWWEDYDHEDALTSSTKIIIKSSIPSEDTITISKELYAAKSKKQLENFRNLFINSERTGYCCCPDINYKILFYYYENNFEYYEVDTTEFKNKIRV